jgi:hypothetical protein
MHFGMAAAPAVRLALVMACSLILGACGGGGGGGDGGAPALPPGQSLQISTTQINFGTAANGPTPPAVSVAGTVTGNPAQVFVIIAHTNVGIEQVTVPIVNGNLASSAVVPRNPAVLGEGIFTDTIVIRACADAACSQQFANSPQTITVTYRIGIGLTPATIAIQAVEGNSPTPVGVAVSYFEPAASWSSTTSYPGASGWLTLQPTSGALPSSTSLAFAATLPAGDYAAQVQIAVGSAQRILPVTYRVLPLLEATSPPPFNVTSQQPAAGQSRTIAVTTRDATRHTAWTAALHAPAPWLRVVTTAGNTSSNDSLRVELVPEEVARLRNGEHTAQVALDPALPGASTVIVPVAITLDRVHVSTVSPYVGAAQRAGDVIIRGERLAEVTIQEVRFGSVVALDWQQLGPTKLRARFPQLPTGRHTVTLITTTGATLDSGAELVVVEPADYARAARTPAPMPFVQHIVFDAEREQCIYADPSGIGAVRLDRASGTWTTQIVPAQFTLVAGATLSTDGRELLVYDVDKIVRFDPATLAERGRVDIGLRQSGGALRALDDATVVFVQNDLLRRYDPARGLLSTIGLSGSSVTQIFTSRAGDRIIWRPNQFGFTTYNIIDSEALTSGFFFETSGDLMKPISDTLANRWAIIGFWSHGKNEVLITNAQGTTLGHVPSEFLEDATLSGDGQTFAFSARFRRLGPSSSGPDPRIDFMDLSGIDPVTPPTLIGSVSVTGDQLTGLHLTPDEREVVICNSTDVAAVAVP